MASDQNLSEQDLQNMSVQYQQMQYQVEAISQQVQMVSVSIDECSRAINTINEFEGVEDEHDILIPIGYGTKVKAKLVKPDNVIIDVGAEVSVEKDLDNAKQTLEIRKEELTKYKQNMQNSLNEIVTQMKQIEAAVTKAAAKKQKAQQRPMQGS